MKLSICGACCSFFLLSPFVVSDERKENFYNLSLSQLGKVEITTATGNSTPLDRAPATATVISSDDIRAMGARHLDEVLETVPGLHVSLSSLSRLDSVYSIRGIHTGFNPHVLLLLNGVPIQFSLQGGRPALLKLPVTSIEQVEVIKGPGSAIYGADAYSGVINILTKDAVDTDIASVGASSGTFGYQEIWSQKSFSFGSWRVLFDLTYQKYDGDEERIVNSDLQTALDAALGTSASLAPSYLSSRYEVIDTHIAASSDRWKVNLWHWDSRDAGVGAGAAQALDLQGHDDSRLYLVDVAYELKDSDQDWDFIYRASYFNYDLKANFNLLPPGAIVPLGGDGNLNFATPAGVVAFPDGLIGNPGANTVDSQLEFISVYEGLENHRVRVAVGAKSQELDTNEEKNFGPGVIDGTVSPIGGQLTSVSDTEFVFAKDSKRDIVFLSLQDEWRFAPDWELTAGVRYDSYSDFGSTINPRAALVWSASEFITAKFLYGSAFRAPSFSEQFNRNNPVSLGDEDLNPETINTYELSLNFRMSEGLQTNLNLFSYDAEDMIEFVPDEGATTSTARNIRDQQGKGFEWELAWQLDEKIWFKGNYSVFDAENDADDVADAPTKQADISFNWSPYKNNFIFLGANWVADRKRVSSDPREEVDDYLMVDFVFKSENILKNIDVSLSAKNIADKKAYEPSVAAIPDDYPLAGREFWAKIHYHFN